MKPTSQSVLRAGLLLLISVLSSYHATGAESSPVTRQKRLLNALETAFPVSAWNLDHAMSRCVTDAVAKVGATVVELSGNARIAGAKGDATLYEGTLHSDCELSIWVCLKADSNVSQVGLQVIDAKGERLMCLVPADWNGWKPLLMDPATSPFKPSYDQKNQNGKVDLPCGSVRVVWFTKEAGPTSLIIDGLSAVTGITEGQTGLQLTAIGSGLSEAGHGVSQRFVAENLDSSDRQIEIRYTVQANPFLDDSTPPDPVLGVDHAFGCSSTFTVDGQAGGDARMCDGDDNSCGEAPWGKGYKEAVATIDLKQQRNLTAVQYVAGDANWIWKADVSVSTDGTLFTPVQGLQGFNMHKKWARQSLPWPATPVAARWLRFRFHDDGKSDNCIRMPVSVMAFDGASNDVLAVPKTGDLIETGTVAAKVPAHDYVEIPLAGKITLAPGGYLLGTEIARGGRTEVRWSQYFVRPSDDVDTRLTQRFGINASQVSLAGELRRCGFGWVRFENAKWMMFCTARDHYAFDGSVAPWGVDHDGIFAAYQALGMKVLPYVFQPPEWATSAPADIKKNRHGYPPSNPADYGDAIFQIVARDGSAKVEAEKLKTADRKSAMKTIDAIELWNEPNLNSPGWGPFVGTMAQYFDVMRAGAEGSRRADPSLPVSSCGFAGIGLEVVGLLAEHRYPDGKRPLDFVDIVNVHFYSGREEPEICGWDPNVDREKRTESGHTYPDQIEDLVAWRDELKPKAEIWLTETGNDVGGPIGRTERYQAGKVPRAVMIALAEGIEKVFIYREKGSDPSQHAGAGLLRNDLSLRPSWFSVATMIRQLQGFNGRALRLPSADPKVWIYLWDDGHRKLITAWRYEGTATLGVDLGKVKVCDAFGRSVPLERTGDLIIGDMPQYITLLDSTTALERWIGEAKAAAAKHAAERRALSAVTARLFDFGPPGQRVGVLKGYGLPRRYQAVDRKVLWNESRGYGFSTEAMEDGNRQWMHDPLGGDYCKIGAGTVFRFSLPAGEFKIRVSAEPLRGRTGDVVLKTDAGEERRAVDSDTKVVEFTAQGGGQPLEVTIPVYGALKWISAISAMPGQAR